MNPDSSCRVAPETPVFAASRSSPMHEIHLAEDTERTF
ncbi:hypothetical protein MIZ01_1411 [Sideroxyarcus emersonii]|uniref:Uncharacterized protein n=1 Tax=Sideroxyarcus emersonii TaxID=2764705 RepID=A0AAN1X9W1_9PROT|nr:hypothetical protein MIZ01_1411 [Sideroxyarcus emersonii]